MCGQVRKKSSLQRLTEFSSRLAYNDAMRILLRIPSWHSAS